MRHGKKITYHGERIVHLHLDLLHKLAVELGVGLELVDRLLGKVFQGVHLDLAENLPRLAHDFPCLYPGW